MATFTHKPLGQSSIASASNTTVYTLPASTQAIVKIIWICNTTTSDVTLEMWYVPNGSSADNAHKLLPGVTIPASDFKQINTDMGMITAGDTIQAKGSTNNAITISLFGATIA